MNIKFFLLCTAFMAMLNVNAQKLGSITGIILDKTSQKPIDGVSISSPNFSEKTVSNVSGNFILKSIKPGTYNIIFTKAGYQIYTFFNVIINTGNQNVYTIELEPTIVLNTEIIVKNNRKPTVRAATLETPLSVQRLTTEEIKANPGGNFDISRVIQSLPGVGGTSGSGGFRNDIIIRGGAPNENVFYLDGIEVPVINHFQTQGSSGGPQGMLNVSFIEDVKLSSSAFDARYDNALASVFQFKQKNGNPNKAQGNFRLSATEAALTLEGPLSKKTTYLASVRRSYLDFLFKAIDLPIRPSYWDFQTKINHKIDNKTTLTFIGIGAIDNFKLAEIKNATPEKLYINNNVGLIQQWNYTVGFTLKRLVKNGFWNLAISRTAFNNNVKRYENNKVPVFAERNLDVESQETENKFRFDVNKTVRGIKIAYGAGAQFVNYESKNFVVIKKELRNNANVIIQPAVISNFVSPLKPFAKLGAFVQASKRMLNQRLGLSAGLRADGNTFTTNGMNLLNTLSPRISASYVIADKITANASLGSYYKIAPYTILGFADNFGNQVNKNVKYLQNNHYVAGFEYLPSDNLRITIEGFYKTFSNVPVSNRTGISLTNLGGDFNILGNEAVTTNGKGKSYGIEFFAQQKLTKNFFGIFSYTYFKSKYSGANGILVRSAWDNNHLLSFTWGYKFKRNWELGLKFRYQGGLPYTPFDLAASQLNYLSQGAGILDFTRLNQNTLRSFNSSDVRIDKKINFRKVTLDLYLDVQNWYLSKNAEYPAYTFKRNATNTAFLTTDAMPINVNGSNAIPTLLADAAAQVTPTIGVIVEF